MDSELLLEFNGYNSIIYGGYSIMHPFNVISISSKINRLQD